MEERLTWDEMVKRYPDRWVAVKDAEMDWPDIVSGQVVAVLKDDEIGDYKATCEPNLIFDRTTEGNWYGPINASFTIKVE